MTSKCTAVLRIGHSVLSVRQAVRNYMGVFSLQYCMSFAETRVKNIFGNEMGLRNFPNQSCSSYVRYVRLGRPKSRIRTVLPLGELLNHGSGRG